MYWKYHTLAYNCASGTLQHLRQEPYAFALQSSGAQGQRFDIFGADPAVLITHTAGQTTVLREGRRYIDSICPFEAIEAEMDRRRGGLEGAPDLPFTGGAVGYFGYELAYGLEKLPPRKPDSLNVPALMVGIYDWFVLVDHEKQCATLVATPNLSDGEFGRIRSILTHAAPQLGTFERTTPVCPNLTRAQYDQRIEKIHEYIVKGDCYQVNLTQRFETTIEGDPIGLYEAILSSQKAPYAACLMAPEVQVQSFSPERFVRVEDGRVTTQPIKGTRRRGRTDAEDAALALELRGSEKDRAENLMIVDLLRNDLGKCCKPGSIRVEKLFELQSFPNVHHLVSTVTGELRNGVSPMALLKAAFPGGSITGAPKVRAMEIIHELEPHERGPYCGAIGYYSYNGNLDTNLSIRTLVYKDGSIYYWGGGGIVADSVADDEYAESLAKVDFIRRALGPQRGRSSVAAQHTRW
ncbi:MAG: aminodeoxychorismate synthase component I [Pseudomonadales bacterium]